MYVSALKTGLGYFLPSATDQSSSTNGVMNTKEGTRTVAQQMKAHVREKFKAFLNAQGSANGLVEKFLEKVFPKILIQCNDTFSEDSTSFLKGREDFLKNEIYKLPVSFIRFASANIEETERAPYNEDQLKNEAAVRNLLITTLNSIYEKAQNANRDTLDAIKPEETLPYIIEALKGTHSCPNRIQLAFRKIANLTPTYEGIKSLVCFFPRTCSKYAPSREGIKNFFMTIGKSVASLVAIGSIGLAWVCKPEEMFTNVTRKNVDASLKEYRDNAGAIAWVLLTATGLAALFLFSCCRKAPAPVVSQPDPTKPKTYLELKEKLEAIQWQNYLLIIGIKILSFMILGMIFANSLIIWYMSTRGILIKDQI